MKTCMQVSGADEQHTVSGVTFGGVSINRAKLAADSKSVQIGQHVSEVRMDHAGLDRPQGLPQARNGRRFSAPFGLRFSAFGVGVAFMKTKRVFRTDSEFRSMGAMHRAAQWVRNGRIGKRWKVLTF